MENVFEMERDKGKCNAVPETMQEDNIKSERVSVKLEEECAFEFVIPNIPFENVCVKEEFICQEENDPFANITDVGFDSKASLAAEGTVCKEEEDTFIFANIPEMVHKRDRKINKNGLISKRSVCTEILAGFDFKKAIKDEKQKTCQVVANREKNLRHSSESWSIDPLSNTEHELPVKEEQELNRYLATHTDKTFSDSINSNIPRGDRIKDEKAPSDQLLSNATDDLFSCSECSTKFKKKQDLATHIQTKHSKELTFLCEQCPARFRFKANLRRHKKIHEEDRPFICETCYCSFKFKPAFRHHTRSCQLHPEKFRRKGALCHGVRKERKKPLDCEFCGAVFENRHDLRRHIRSHYDQTFTA